MKNIIVKSSEVSLINDVYMYNNNKYISINGERDDSYISLILKTEYDVMIKNTIDLINSTQELINTLKNKG